MIKAVGMQGDGLPRPHVLKLCFLEIGSDPDIVDRDDRQKCLARLYAMSEFNGLVAYNTTNCRVNLRVAQVQFSRMQFRASLLDGSFSGRLFACAFCNGCGAVCALTTWASLCATTLRDWATLLSAAAIVARSVSTACAAAIDSVSRES